MKGLVGHILNLLGSVAISLLAGNLYFMVFKKNLPEAVQTQFSHAAAQVTFMGVSVLFGVLIFAWTFLAVKISQALSGRPKPKT